MIGSLGKNRVKDRVFCFLNKKTKGEPWKQGRLIIPYIYGI